MSDILIIEVEFSDNSDFEFFRQRMVSAVEEVVEVALNGDEESGEPARADGTIEVSWDVESKEES